MLEDARLLGQRSYIFEVGSGLVIDGEIEWLTGGLEPRRDRQHLSTDRGRGRPDDAAGAVRRPARVPRALAHGPRRLASLSRLVDTAEVDAFRSTRTATGTCDWLTTAASDASPRSSKFDHLHAYHLIPKRREQGERRRAPHADPRILARRGDRLRRLARRSRGRAGGRRVLPDAQRRQPEPRSPGSRPIHRRT